MLDAELAGRMVRYHRRQAGLSRTALADLAGVGKTSIFAIERGKPTVRVDTLAAVLRALNITARREGPLVARFLEEDRAAVLGRTARGSSWTTTAPSTSASGGPRRGRPGLCYHPPG